VLVGLCTGMNFKKAFAIARAGLDLVIFFLIVNPGITTLENFFMSKSVKKGKISLILVV
jgi:hypothetical protein